MGHEDLRGVIPAVPTPFDDAGRPDCNRLIAFIRDLLAAGCDGVNLLGTTGEATSLDKATRIAVMEAVAENDDILPHMMVGTGAAALSDAVALTNTADRLGFKAALLLPPFYYKGITDNELAAYVEQVAVTSKLSQAKIYLYNFPQLTGITYQPEAVRKIADRLGPTLAGIKDSSGDLAYSRNMAETFPALGIFPSSETTLRCEGSNLFAGCISATVNVRPELAVELYRSTDSSSGQRTLETLTQLRKSLTSVPLVAAVKFAMSLQRSDPFWSRTMFPLSALNTGDSRLVQDALAASF